MKLRKILAAVAASAFAVTAMAATASATFKVLEQNGHFFSGTGMWMPLLYSDGTKDVADGKEYTDYGLDLSKIGSIEVTITPEDPDWFDGSFGGGIILSSAGTDHNWVSKNFWGVVDEELEIDSLDTSSPVQFVKTGDYTYTGVCYVDETNNVPEGTALVQLAIQEWGQNMTDIIVKSVVVKDLNGSEMIAFDETGKANLPLIPQGGAVEEVVVAPAPEAGDVAAVTESSKGSPDTGVADVAAVAGLALVAGAAFVVAKKRG